MTATAHKQGPRPAGAYWVPVAVFDFTTGRADQPELFPGD